jgi:hypothetical protein
MVPKSDNIGAPSFTKNRSNTKSALRRLHLLAKSRRPHPEASHPALASGSGSPLPSLGAGLGERARLVGFTNQIWYEDTPNS